VIELAGQLVTRVRSTGFGGGVSRAGGVGVVGVASPAAVDAPGVARAAPPGLAGVPAKAAPAGTIAARVSASVTSFPAVTVVKRSPCPGASRSVAPAAIERPRGVSLCAAGYNTRTTPAGSTIE
jgi:hypothetical protein